ncbi:MAG: endolytic transglycosylase MltG [Lachnospiraceae bacterium]|nr:endolytic transglycosylase MltG [Lachnospiraceae bacterium]
MKRKYYLRGLGVGILVTCLIFGIIHIINPSTLTDAQIREKAYQMGMVDKDYLESTKEEPEEEVASASAISEGALTSAMNDNESEDKDLSKDKSASDEKQNKSEKEDGDINSDQDSPEKPKDNTTVSTTVDQDGNTTTIENRTGRDVTKAPDNRTSPVQEKSTESEQTERETAASDSEEKVSFSISGGQNSNVVGRNLYSAGLVEDADEFDSYLEQNGYDRVIRPGSYEIPKDASYEDIARIITGRR